jgi:hypothetical protein
MKNKLQNKIFVISFSHEKTANFKMDCWYVVGNIMKYYLMYSVVSN